MRSTPRKPEPSRRDGSFLTIAAIAGAGGVLAIGIALVALWAYLTHRTATPAFMLFALWGIAALGGAYASVRTYLDSGIRPEPPPRGGRRLEVIEGGAAPPAPQQRAA